ncbi:MAG: hypothetical protein ABI699_12850 [Caldimonas sp.]
MKSSSRALRVCSAALPMLLMLGSGASAQRLLPPMERWLAIEDQSAVARSRFFELIQIAAPVCHEAPVWTLGPFPYFVAPTLPPPEVLRQWREIVVKEFPAAQPGEYVFTHEPLGMPFGRAGARRGDRMVPAEALPATGLADDEVRAGLRSDEAASAPPAALGGKPTYKQLVQLASVEYEAGPQRRFVLRRNGEEVPITASAVRTCPVGFSAIESTYSYVHLLPNSVFATLPLLASVSEPELTMVLANEVSHVVLGHAHLFDASILINPLSPIGNLLGMAKNRETDRFPLPEKELIDADKLTLWLLKPYRLGPVEYLAFLQRMDGLSDPTMKASYVRTRPLTPKRAAALQASVKLYGDGRKLYHPKGMTLEKLHEVTSAGIALHLPGSARHALSPPPRSSYATVAQLDLVPVRTEGRDRFAHYLTLPAPKAFLVYANGDWRFWSGSNAMTLGLDSCQAARRSCWLYAVDNEVVWQADVAQRIGSKEALGTLPTAKQ